MVYLVLFNGFLWTALIRYRPTNPSITDLVIYASIDLPMYTPATISSVPRESSADSENYRRSDVSMSSMGIFYEFRIHEYIAGESKTVYLYGKRICNGVRKTSVNMDDVGRGNKY